MKIGYVASLSALDGGVQVSRHAQILQISEVLYPRVSGRKFQANVPCFVSRAVIADNQLEVAECLAEETVQRPRQHRRPVVRNEADANWNRSVPIHLRHLTLQCSLGFELRLIGGQHCEVAVQLTEAVVQLP
jgi:hypothetical protein